MNQTAIEVVEPKGQITALSLLQMAVDRGANIDTIERLAKLQREMMDHEAMVEFNHAMQRCQEKMKRIATDMTNPQTHSRYASYAQIDRAIRPIYTGEGLSLSFGDGEPLSPETVRIICYVAKGGFTRIYHKDMPIVTAGPQGKAVMTPTHATGSADSYAKRYLVKDIFNLAVGEDDVDGNPPGGIGEDVVSAMVIALEACKDLVELQRVFGEAYKAAGDDKNAAGQIIRARDKRKQELKSTPQSAPQGGNRIAEPLTVERLEWIKGANDKAELTRIYNNAIKMANQAGDAVFADQLTKAANARAEAIRADR